MTSTDTTSATDRAAGDRVLKERHRAMWASGDYPTVARTLIPGFGPELVAACGIGPGARVLDVAAGPGNVALAAAEAGADVVAGDLTPELLDAGRAEADARGLRVDWQTADAEALPFPDSAFDAVVSSVGVMFAPHHQQAADELVRVCRPGGRIGLITWTPDGFVGQMLAAMKPYVAPPPPGASSPLLWGDPDHVAMLLGDRVEALHCEREELDVDAFPGRSDLREFFARNYGPTVAAYRGLAEAPERVEALDAALDDVAARFRDPAGAMRWGYLRVTARRA